MSPLRAELIEIILLCSLAVVVLSLFLIACAARLRLQAARRADRLNLYRSLVSQALAARSDARDGHQGVLASLRATAVRDRCPELEQALLECVRSTAAVDAGRRIADDLGFLARWRQGLCGEPGKNGNGRFSLHRRPRFLTRARCASNLATVRDRASLDLLARALGDSHPDVQQAALRALAEFKAPQLAPVIAGLLTPSSSRRRRAMSERSLCAAWGQLPVAHRAELLPCLAHPESGIRRLALSMLVQTPPASGAAEPPASLRTPSPRIPPSVLNAIIADPDAEVRARAADLLATQPGDRTQETLRTLLDDSAWFVRLHAVHAIAARRCPSGAECLKTRLTDSHWRVRESAAQALSALGSEGLDRLLATFHTTSDAYAREQITEAMEASGHAALLDRVSGGDERARGAVAATIRNSS